MRERIEAIDFWRGVALATIFINHIPGNVLGNFTPRNFGFSDSAEAFVFLSGLSVSLAYGKRFESGAILSGTASLLRRAFRLYRVHLFLTISALVLFAAATWLTGQEALLGDYGRGTAFTDPLRGLLGIATLTHQLGYFNILPLYVLFLLLAPALFVSGLRSPWKMLGISASLYAASRILGINIPSWPDEGSWYFNPMAWQFMFALGMFSGLVAQKGKVLLDKTAYSIAHGFTFIAAVIVSNGFGLIPGLVDLAGEYLDWDKTQLGTVRIIDFVALAYVIYFSNLTARLRAISIYSATSLLGRHALPVYCMGALLSSIGQIFKEIGETSQLFDILFVAASLKCLHTLAAFMERRSSAQLIAA